MSLARGSRQVYRLTDKLVRSLPAPTQGSKIYYDEEVTGFGERVTKADARAFVLNYRNRAGRERRYTIGRVQDWKTVAARTEAKRLKQEIRVNGADPVEALDTERSAPTVADLAERYKREHLPTKRPSSQREDKAMIEKIILPEMKHLKVADVDREDIAALHRKLTKAGAPVRANRVLALLSKMFSLATESGKRRLRDDNPCRGVKRNAEEGRERYLSAGEIARLMKALIEHEDQEAANAIMLALLTGARRGELLRASWDQFELADGIWIRPSSHTKQKKKHRVPLSAPALELLKKMSAERKGDYLFPGRIGANGRVDIRRPWEQVCLSAGLAEKGSDGRIKPHVRFHDLRHSYASMLAGSGLSLPIIGRLLGHTQAQTTQRYAHLADDPLRQATSIVGELVAGNKPT